MLAVAINAVTLALIDAGIPMKDFVVACAASFVEGVTLNDPNYNEDRVGGPNLPLALMPKTGKVQHRLSIELAHDDIIMGSSGGEGGYERLLRGLIYFPSAFLWQVVLLQMHDTLHLDNFAELMEMASKGCRQIFDTLQSEVKEYAVQLVELRGGTVAGR